MSRRLKNRKTRGRKHKAIVLTTPTDTTIAVGVKYYCKMHGPNRTCSTKDCFELKRRAKRAKADTNCGGTDK
eukprot:10910383-Ditylum_brightwellii.AAC.1